MYSRNVFYEIFACTFFCMWLALKKKSMKINWALIKDLCPYQGVCSEWKHKERLLLVTCFLRGHWKSIAALTFQDTESPDSAIYYYSVESDLYTVQYCICYSTVLYNFCNKSTLTYTCMHTDTLTHVRTHTNTLTIDFPFLSEWNRRV